MSRISVIRHFKQPFRQDVRKVQALREKCESGFELEMFDELVKRGFRVEPQVQCGGYRIDFVVEGNEGTTWPSSATETDSTARVSGRTTWRVNACWNGPAGRSGAASCRASSAAASRC